MSIKTRVNVRFTDFLKIKLQEIFADEDRIEVLKSEVYHFHKVVEYKMVSESHKVVTSIREIWHSLRQGNLKFTKVVWRPKRHDKTLAWVEDSSCDDSASARVDVTVYSEEWRDIIFAIASEYEEMMSEDYRHIQVHITYEINFKKKVNELEQTVVVDVDSGGDFEKQNFADSQHTQN